VLVINRYVIHSLQFNEKAGGVVALHHLCHLLNKKGVKAYMYFNPNYYLSIKRIIKLLLFYFGLKRKYFIDYKHLKVGVINAFKLLKYNRFKNFITPTSSKIKNETIVIYPEITDGNPLNASNVVRWFLHKPGFHTGTVNYGKNELYFFNQKSFNDININPNTDTLLRIILIRDDIFYNKGLERQGSCYAIRKGKGKKIVHDLKDSVLIDNLSLEEISMIFNTTEFFYSYDIKTMYYRYAVICGCKPIVIPDEGISKEEWQPEEELRYGIAYGVNDLDYAENTKELFFKTLEKMKEENIFMIERFIEKCDSFFNKNQK